MRPGDTSVVTTDGLVHTGSHRGMKDYVFSTCGRFVCVRGLGSPEARREGAEGGTEVSVRDAVTCVRCASEFDDWDEGWRYKHLQGVR